MVKHKKAQSTLEYILLVTAVIVVIIIVVAGKNGLFQKTLQNTLEGATGKMQDMSGVWQKSIPKN